MKFIIKSESPADFENWKRLANENWQPNWDNFQNPEKGTVHKSLLAEQGHICCYCEMRVDEDSSHIEHLKPKSIYPDESLNYQNMLASCQSNQERRAPRHCGALKDNWYDDALMISPLSPDCEGRFRFTAYGEIYRESNNDKAVDETIQRLGLNIEKLQALRRNAIIPIINALGSLNENEIDNLATGFQDRNENGEFAEFCTAIVYILRNYS